MSCCTCTSIFYAFIAAIVLRFLYKQYKANAAAAFFAKKEKVVVITGCSSGIGADMAKQYAAQPGTKLVIAARRKEQLEQIKAECAAAGCANVTVVPTDVSKESDCKALIEAAVAAYGRIDVVILNAGVAQNFFFTAAQNTEVLRPTMEVNFWGCVWTAYYAFPHLCATKGRLGVVSSVLGHVTLPRTSLYNASKHALEGFFNTIRLEWRPSGVSVSMLNPGFIDTPMVSGEAVTASGQKEKERSDKKTSSSVMPIKMMSSHDCAAALIKAIGARVPKAVVPGYYWILIYIYWLLPEVSDFFLGKMVGRPKKMEPKSN